MNICLNMIICNERKNILRCLESVAPYISSWVICDTGSTDCTQQLIMDFMFDRGIVGELHEFEFVNFAHSRNRALQCVRDAGFIEYDYVLLMDADMEMCVEHTDPFNALTAPYYQMRQHGGGLSYWNTRLIRRGHPANYVGVTHEYIDTAVTPDRMFEASFIDHADGGSRGNKFARDYELLIKDLDRDPNNTRTVYYLAQTLKDMGKPYAAAGFYDQRAGMPGWSEETWHAQLMAARCYLLGSADRDGFDDEDAFVHGALKAYSMRPWRSEPLLSLATHYRLKGANELAVMFAKQGLSIPYPSHDILFVETDAYHAGFVRELKIIG